MTQIVVIEDNRDLRELLVDTLTCRGYTVLHTRDARAGIALCEHCKPDVLITDLNVPNRESLEDVVGQGTLAASIVVISGALDSPPMAALAQRLAGPNVLGKPFRMQDLIRLVESLVGVPAA